MFKKVFLLIAAICLLTITAKADMYTIGVPTSLTVTTTTVGTSWTLLLDSDLSSPKPAKKWRIYEKTSAFDMHYTYNNLTWTVVDDYLTCPSGTQACYYMAIPTGIYVKTTWAASGNISVQFESVK